ncbi:sensor domain-containing diguanylate cyclase [Alteromonas sp. C1M14]|uniref:sensor domain-containing diguanylate cyclase n=1 Tax=Alteromonas sp. C1M14 TaxID=2841567 RepID=UPI001C08ABC1|nr:sensor domain-containing diguanylate cyclase [Alteromonas sp. C1M14]MBU2977543.1 GGDEF domain-containing protein [Alteromonas sp. C1M14]
MHWQTDLLNSIEVGIVVLDRDLRIEVWNQFMANHADKLPSEVTGQSLFSLFPEIEEKWLRSKAEPVFNLNTPVFIIWEQRPYLFKFASSRPITSDASHMFQNVTMFPLSSPDGTIQRLCMLVYDVTDEALRKLRIERLNDELKHMSRIDGLTGLFNRRYWQEQFDRVYKLACRKHGPTSVMMLDIDHFKNVNDTYGHQAGDAVIRVLARVIQKSIRETDVAGRYGGEEFSIILEDSTLDNARKVGERIRRLAEAMTVEHEGRQIPFTVSIGVSEYSADIASAMTWLDYADKALYLSKKNGRNQVTALEIETA